LFLAGLVLVLASSCQNPGKNSVSGSSDALLALYRHPQLRFLVEDYYSQLTGDRTVAQVILETCDQLDLDPSLGFALAWNESHFNPRAVSYNPTTVDRGLFQLNSRSFAGLDRKTVFDPRSNALRGLTYFKTALAKLGTEEKALGYYNSGIGLLSDRALPRSTQAYVKKILADRDRMDRDAIAWIYFSHDTHLALR
jgi:soluble lytic murein transglycosylase-like protein